MKDIFLEAIDWELAGDPAENGYELNIKHAALSRESRALSVVIGADFVVPFSSDGKIKEVLRREIPGAGDVSITYEYELPLKMDEETAVKLLVGRIIAGINPAQVNSYRVDRVDVTDDAVTIRVIGKGRASLFTDEYAKAIRSGLGIIPGMSREVYFVDDEDIYRKTAEEAEILEVKAGIESMTPPESAPLDGDRKELYPSEKRVELHVHTRMSVRDGVTDPSELLERAVFWGQDAVAVTDHGSVQSFPEIRRKAIELSERGKKIKVIYGMEGYVYDDEEDEEAAGAAGEAGARKRNISHIIMLAKNEAGIRNLYKLVTLGHLDHFYRVPRLPRSVIEEHRDGLILGSACVAGEVYQALFRHEPEEKVMRLASFYDYLEIQPIVNNSFMVRNDMVFDEDDLVDMNKRIVELAEKVGKPVCATTDSHYKDPDDAVVRKVMQTASGFGKDEDLEGGDGLHLKTTHEMLSEFSYLGDVKAKEVVIDNTAMIAGMVEEGLGPFVHGEEEPREIALDVAPEEAEAALNELYETYGRENVYMAGAAGLLTQESAENYITMYQETAGKMVRRDDREGILAGLMQVKVRQEVLPGRFVAVPEGKDILDYTPLQYATGDQKKQNPVTHFDFDELRGDLVKISIRIDGEFPEDAETLAGAREDEGPDDSQVRWDF